LIIIIREFFFARERRVVVFGKVERKQEVRTLQSGNSLFRVLRLLRAKEKDLQKLPEKQQDGKQDCQARNLQRLLV